MGKGYLRVKVTEGNSVLPVPGVKVIIKDVGGSVIRELVTDENGLTAETELFAPDADLSRDLDYSGAVSEHYTVHIDPSERYKGTDVFNAEIFDGIRSIQPIYLTFNIDDADTRLAGYDEIALPLEHGIQIRRGIDQESIPAESPEDPRASRAIAGYTVKIPQFVTVHLGTYTSTAQNVTVPFKDYIKNVASHEILPTWNEAALYANIYCHISFILNRVYTVWYRSRGYNFDITNSTTTDQYYVYGGTVFDNISNIVDEIFNIYAKREGHREPYFTEYCDGRTVHCPGLWQWGSDALAQAGYTPIQILHYYYPDDLRLAEATEYTDTNETYPGYVLTQGSSGLEVRIMQDYLNRISANYPLIPKITDSPGYYGASTTAAVKVFEEAFGLRVTGDISKGVWYEITYIYVAVKKLAELTGEGEFIGIDKTPPTTTIRLGSKGEDTARLQFILNYISEYYANIPGVIEDATFGQTTENAVKAFQSYFNVTPADGIVGPTTWKKLFDVYWAIYNSTPSTDAPAYPGTVLKIGSKNESVRLMQQYLNKIGETYPSIPKLVVDGQFGTGTYNAVVAFQKLFGLTPDGIIGKNTWDKIVYQYNYDAPSDAYTPGYPGYLLKLGGSGEYVTVLQDHLDAISKSYPSIPPVSIDGKFGAGTQSAVIEFQKLFNLTPDGVVGEQTWNKMAQVYLGLPKYAPPYPGIVIRQDSRGQDVLTIQEEINAISNVYPSVPKVSEDGIFGAGTKNAVAAFQSQFGLSSDGIVGKTTWNKLASVYNVIGGGGVRLTTVSKADDITPNSTIPSGAETTVKNQSVREAPNNAALLLAMRLFMR